MARRHRVAQGVSPGMGEIFYLNPDAGRGGILSRRSTKCEDGNDLASIYYIAFPSSGFRLRSLRSYAVTGAPYAVTGCHPTIRWDSTCFFASSMGSVRVAHSTRGYLMPPSGLLILVACGSRNFKFDPRNS